jgi:hypothetical protein
LTSTTGGSMLRSPVTARMTSSSAPSSAKSNVSNSMPKPSAPHTNFVRDNSQQRTPTRGFIASPRTSAPGPATIVTPPPGTRSRSITHSTSVRWRKYDCGQSF